MQSVKLPDGNIKVLVEGAERAKIVQVTSEEGFFRATVRLIPVKAEPSPQLEQAAHARHRLLRAVRQAFAEPELRHDDRRGARGRSRKLSDTIAANLQIPVEEKQELLEIFDPLERLNRVGEILEARSKS